MLDVAVLEIRVGRAEVVAPFVPHHDVRPVRPPERLRSVCGRTHGAALEAMKVAVHIEVVRFVEREVELSAHRPGETLIDESR